MLTQEYITKLFDYDPETGIFIWKQRSIDQFVSKRAFSTWNARFSLKKAGSVRKDNGYVNLTINNKHYFAHRLAWLYVYGVIPSLEIDHINGVRDDNRIVNLREATSSDNKQNRHKCSKNSLTGLLGVRFSKRTKRFSSTIFLKGKAHHLGSFDSKEEAYSSYVKAKSDLHPFSMLSSQ